MADPKTGTEDHAEEPLEGDILEGAIEESGEGPTTPTGDDAEDVGRVVQLEEELDRLAEENTELRDKLARSRAELANERKWFKQQKAQAGREAIGKLAVGIADALGGLEKAIDMVEDDAVHRGLKQVEGDLLKMLEQHEVTIIRPAEGDAFDPNVHEAVGPGSERIAQTLRPGVQVAERVVRAALVALEEA